MKTHLLPLIILSLFAALAIAPSGNAEAPPAPKAEAGPAVTPQPRIEEWWFARHAEKIGILKKEEVELLMLGDSITHNFESVGESAWEEYFTEFKPVNLGFGGDRTNHLLWRMDHLPKLKKDPTCAVVLIGTNNICWGSDTPEQAAHGVRAVAEKLNASFPETKILVLGVFPRRRELTHPHRKEIIELNQRLPKLLESIPHTEFLDIGNHFLDENGHLSKEMMPDTTHPSEEAHAIWGKVLQPKLRRIFNK